MEGRGTYVNNDNVSSLLILWCLVRCRGALLGRSTFAQPERHLFCPGEMMPAA